MRIIAGEFGGRQLLPPEGEVTRPITDRVKQSLFDIVAPLVEGAVVYDLFAGTGSLGLESLSRGARLVYFFESDRTALARLNQNIMALRASERSRIIPGDLFKWFERSTVRPDPAGPRQADLIFLDPPYRFLRERGDEIVQLVFHLTQGHLKPSSTLVFRHDSHDQLPLPKLDRYDVREYGGMTLEFLRPFTS
jgi:16S rRNA (guanine(966)-N(2))-methyltransferase RsmD